jgi:hypothetical protein
MKSPRLRVWSVRAARVNYTTDLSQPLTAVEKQSVIPTMLSQDEQSLRAVG